MASSEAVDEQAGRLPDEMLAGTALPSAGN
jgi:hypothetical protein